MNNVEKELEKIEEAICQAKKCIDKAELAIEKIELCHAEVSAFLDKLKPKVCYEIRPRDTSLEANNESR